MPAVAKTVLAIFPPDTLKPGDVILVNDSFIGAGPLPRHLRDHAGVPR